MIFWSEWVSVKQVYGPRERNNTRKIVGTQTIFYRGLFLFILIPVYIYIRDTQYEAE